MRLRFLFALIPALMLAACAAPGGYYSGQRGYGPPQDGYARCHDCGVVEKIDRVYGERGSSGGGAILGGIIGGIVGNQIGSGSGRAAATAAGAIAGGMVGNNAERNASSAPWYELYIRMDDGRRIVVSQRDLNGVREGAYIHISNGRAYLR
ncbi:MAG TPA: glycine zipper 2TM domain-containing protein [Chiayiivirga sp.]|jgi:outer membrane lipoprotein SlyB|uniref:Glycine zipper 2TM domain-containing protein n=1 Tax=Denitratimonas tolerans TaxID=1338420 RepID=A0AAW9R3C6_9GAMM|nr:glycine zipper 2TM domain-containing protein [Chiayiivirga sp.]MEB2316897.1 glycine zipper 2TM domain-containing protein [Xanthomonadaceae bacterium]HRN59689.1 glycine zipper 2TM domain-containing protein [Chiayiivirga sp.]HRQ34386.1 glycine zipper 2TM domain-containing protein [Chiayiivirga sp.]